MYYDPRDVCNQWFGCPNSWGFIWIYVAVGFGLLMKLFCWAEAAQEEEHRATLHKLGFEYRDVCAFLKTNDWDMDDFQQSTSVRAEYVRWHDGKINIGHKTPPPVSDNSGLATGMIIGMAASQSSHTP